MKVKICGITNLADALASVEAGADALGFNFWTRSARYINPNDAREIVEQLPPKILTVGVFVNGANPESVTRATAAAGVHCAQLHGDESPEFCAGVQGVEVIKALRVSADFQPEEAAGYKTDAILLDAFVAGERGGTGRTFDWSLARRTRELVSKLYLAGGLTPDNVADAIASVRPYAVDVCSGIERAPGRKDMARVRAFIAAARRA